MEQTGVCIVMHTKSNDTVSAMPNRLRIIYSHMFTTKWEHSKLLGPTPTCPLPPRHSLFNFPSSLTFFQTPSFLLRPISTTPFLFLIALSLSLIIISFQRREVYAASWVDIDASFLLPENLTLHSHTKKIQEKTRFHELHLLQQRDKVIQMVKLLSDP
ncbi:hypothetical protein PHAVU_005G110700 [Phaseolus vulgaris]|uniref:Uncharacterized protein n=1 Tax=Phaseolus vulgaris TaxID=3885 RepID=V7BVD8_PHAVU|nr:hypothetical protein PHAVU_005G110700g [Phaseolus vulgaris]ESW21919.1 hypothetical protein PHAVU_005G110700g [Phaseolus vulgaris]